MILSDTMLQPHPLPLIRTKIQAPRLDPHWLPRPRVLSLLAGERERALTLVVAPAGFGKTALVRQWLQGCASETVWLTLDEHDSDPTRLLTYLTAAIRQAIPDACAATLPILGTTTPHTGHLAALLASDLAAIDRPLVIVLDDYHYIESPEAHGLLNLLLNSLPSHIHLVVISRLDPPWPLGRLRLQQRISELRAPQLRWQPEEVQALLDATAGVPADHQLAALLHARTEGWVAGLRLAMLSLRGSHEPASLTAALCNGDRYAMDYLFEEVFSRQPPEVQHFLLVTTMLDRVCAPLADAMLGEPAGAGGNAAMLETLERRGLFLTPLDREQHWFRYHQLFRDLLSQRRRALGDQARWQAALRHAAEWCSAQHLVDEALHYALAAGDTEGAAGMVEAHLHVLLDCGTAEDSVAAVLRRWLRVLPAECQARRPGLIITRAFVSSLTFDIERIPPLLDQADALLGASPESEPWRGDIAALRAHVAFSRGDFAGVHAQSQPALRYIPRQHRVARALVHFFDTLSYALQGRPELAIQLVHDALAAEAPTSAAFETILLSALGSIGLYTGQMRVMLDAAEQLLAHPLPSDSPLPWASWGHYLLARHAYERNELDQAAMQFAAVVDQRYRTNTRCYHDSLLGLALISQARGAEAEARAYAARARDYALDTGSQAMVAVSQSFELRLGLLQGSGAGTRGLDTALGSYGTIITQAWLELPPWSHARALLEQGAPPQLAQARQLLEERLRAYTTIHHPWQEVRLRALHSAVLHALGDQEGAAISVGRALLLGERIGCLRSFVEVGAPIVPVLAQALARGITPLYTSQLLAACGAAGLAPAASITPEQAETLLTEREIEVLRLLAQQLTAETIADQLVIAVATVRKHTANIYNKLQVSNRREAVVRAQKLGLLPAGAVVLK
ncbi:MAG: hypothetical protein OHK0022_12830 [Roseiflexaceae bacterium]